MRYLLAIAFCVLTLAGPEPSWAAAYQVDKDHTVVSFKIRNFMSNTQGFFHDFQGTVDYDLNRPAVSVSQGSINVESIDTKNSERDHHLLSKDFFDVDKFPTIVFRTAEISQAAKDDAQIKGFLDIHGIEKPVLIRVQDLALSQDKNGAEHLKFTATTKIDRRDFGITYSSAGPGKMMLGSDVMVTIQADAIRKD